MAAPDAIGPRVRAVGWAVGGAGVLWPALVAMSSANGLVRGALAAAGAWGLFRAFGAAGRAWRGPAFDAAYVLSVVWLAALAGAAVFADLLPLGEHVDTAKTLADPGNLRPDLLSTHPLGTNNFSLDLLAQSVYGARVSLLTALFAVTLAVVLGGAVGLVAGYFRGATDTSIGVVNDTLLAFPPIILLVALAAVMGPPRSVGGAVLKTGLALAVVGVPTVARLSRASTLVVAQREFVLAARSIGATHRRILVRELAANVALPVLSYGFIILATLIIAEGSLSYLGLGLQQPQPTWGNMIAQADLPTLKRTPHIALVPGAFMFLTVYAFNRVGERARARWDPRASKLA